KYPVDKRGTQEGVMMRLKKILVPVDFTDEAELAVQWAVKLGKEEREATVYLLHVLFPIPIVEGVVGIDSYMEHELLRAKEDLETWRRKVPPPLSSVALVQTGDMYHEISHLCKEHNIDLVIMTTHGRHGVSRLIHPNYSERVVREAPCPVMVLHLNR